MEGPSEGVVRPLRVGWSVCPLNVIDERTERCGTSVSDMSEQDCLRITAHKARGLSVCDFSLV